MYPFWNALLWSIVTLESCRRKWGMHFKAEALFVHLEREVSSQPAWIRSLYDFWQLSWSPGE